MYCKQKTQSEKFANISKGDGVNRSVRPCYKPSRMLASSNRGKEEETKKGSNFLTENKCSLPSIHVSL
jgi:hypothetical protein